MNPPYPSTITFVGVTQQFWTDPTFRNIEKDLGHVEAVDTNHPLVHSMQSNISFSMDSRDHSSWVPLDT